MTITLSVVSDVERHRDTTSQGFRSRAQDRGLRSRDNPGWCSIATPRLTASKEPATSAHLDFLGSRSGSQGRRLRGCLAVLVGPATHHPQMLAAAQWPKGHGMMDETYKITPSPRAGEDAFFLFFSVLSSSFPKSIQLLSLVAPWYPLPAHSRPQPLNRRTA